MQGIPTLTKCFRGTCSICSRSFVETIQEIDGFKYSERHAWNKDDPEGTRFKYICVDSLQNHYRKGNKKEEASEQNGEEETEAKKNPKTSLPTYDCGGAIYVKFSTKRDAINVVYKHNPIHRDVEDRLANKQNSNRWVLTSSAR